MILGFEQCLFVGKLCTELRDVSCLKQYSIELVSHRELKNTVYTWIFDLGMLLYAGGITAFQSKAVLRMPLALLPAFPVHFQNMFRFSVFGDLFDEAIKNGLTAIQVMLIRGC